MPNGVDNTTFRLRFRNSANSDNSPNDEFFRVDAVNIDGDAIVPPAENLLALCTDGINNDGDGATDLADSDCAAFRPKLTVTKVVDGGAASVGDFSLTANPGAIALTSGVQETFTTHGVQYTISETGPDGYTGTFSGDCAADGTITLNANDVKSCTLTNVADEPETGTITIVKEVIGGNGSFDFHIYSPANSETEVGSANIGATVDSDGSTAALEYSAGTYTIYEDQEVGWTLTSATCTDGEGNLGEFIANSGVYNIELGAGDNITCTFVNTADEVAPETGSIEITKYICPIGTEVVRSENGLAEGDTVPVGCVLDEGVTFSYVHGEAEGTGPEYPELALAASGSEDGIGSTNGDGELLFSGLSATGRYLVYESDANGVQLPASDILGLYCEGDGDLSDNNDNQELTFVTEGETARCIAYNEGDFELPVDVCLNIEGDQPVVPVGYQATEGNNCTACTDDSVTIVSDATVDADGSAAIALTGEPVNGNWQHPAWTANIPDATWIWDADGIDNVLVDELVIFTKDFDVNGPVSNAVLDIAADNSYEVFLNGDLVASDPSENNFATADQFVIPNASFDDGENTLEVRVTNKGAEVPENPAGVLFKLTVTAGDCESEEGGGGGDDEATAWITLVKQTPNSYGIFDLTVNGGSTNETRSISTAYAGDWDSEEFGVNPSGEGTNYAISEEIPTGWELTNLYCEYDEYGDEDESGVSLSNGGTISVQPGDDVTCTFTNTATTGFVKIYKEVINDDGENEEASDFTLKVIQGGDQIGSAIGSEDGVFVSVPVGAYHVMEEELENYEPSYSEGCTSEVALGEVKECVVTNDDTDGDDSSSGSEANEGGSVLGASTDTEGSVLGALSCSFLSYEQLLTIKNGNGADPEIVKALQEWLNSSQGAGLTVNGIYDAPTKFAIMLLQEKYASDTLTPWGLTKATGNVWQTTARLIIRLVCGVEMPLPNLAPFAL